MVKVREDLTGWVMSEHGVPDSRLTVIKQTEDYIKPNGKREDRWLCQCLCGGDPIKVTQDKLKSGKILSCGCLQYEARVQSGLKTKNLIPNIKKYNKYDISGAYGIGWASNTNKEFYFDLEDYDKIKSHTWLEDSNGYFIDADTKEFIHRLIMNCPDNLEVDHIGHNKYDNRKSKLRIVTDSQNNMNRGLQSNNTSGITGVSFHKGSSMWFGYVKYNGKQIRKYARTKEKAIELRRQLEEKYFGEYSYANSMNKENQNERRDKAENY